MNIISPAFRLLIIFIILAVCSIIAIALFGVELSKENYWDYHGLILLIFLTFFPRLALLFSSIPFGGIFWWLGWIFCPHYLVAILATINFWPTNPFLVSISWLVALGGEFSEKYVLTKSINRQKPGKNDVIDMGPL
jgi:hypothetical protein